LFSLRQDGDDTNIRHKWRDIIPFTYWHRGTNKLRMLLLRTDPEVVPRLLARMLQILNRNGRPPADALWPYIAVHDELIRHQHEASFAVRDMIIFEEAGRDAPGEADKPRADYPRLHLVAKHATTVEEILEVNVRSLESLVSHHAQQLPLLLAAALPDGSDATAAAAAAAASDRRLRHQRFQLQAQVIFALRARCSSYRARIGNEIARAFNLVAQADARTSVSIAAAARADGRAMTTLGIVTVVFLPPTFISAIFSTTFFNFGADPQSWAVSDKFYVYWASVVPVTVVVAAIFCRGFLQRSAAQAHIHAPRAFVRRLTMTAELKGMESNGTQVSSKLA
jgi:hypothetical protein